jgi:steroid Delta-isomerase
MPSPEHIKQVLQDYVDAMSVADVDAVMSIYAKNAVVEDPVGSEAYVGHDAIRAFYQGSAGAVAKMVLEGNVRVAQNWGACAMLAYPAGMEDSLVIETLDVMEFDEDGKVISMRAYWGESTARAL